jgi:hypothetical protein
MTGTQTGRLSTTQLMSKILFHEGIRAELSASLLGAGEVSDRGTGWLWAAGISPKPRNDCRESIVEAESQPTRGVEENRFVLAIGEDINGLLVKRPCECRYDDPLDIFRKISATGDEQPELLITSRRG